MGKKLTDAKRKAITKYDAVNTRQVHLKLNCKTDADIIEHLKKQESIQGYIKDLIREKMKHQKARGEYALRVAKDWAELKEYITIPLQHGYRDEEAIKTCTEQEHRIYIHRMNQWEIRIDIDDKKVLTVMDRTYGNR